MTDIIAQTAAASQPLISWEQINLSQLVAIAVLVWGILRFFGRRLFRDAVLDILSNKSTQETVANAVLAALELPTVRPRHKLEVEHLLDGDLTKMQEHARTVDEMRSELDDLHRANEKLVDVVVDQGKALAVIPDIRSHMESGVQQYARLEDQVTQLHRNTADMARELGDIGGYLRGLHDQRGTYTGPPYRGPDHRVEDKGPLARGSGA